jgi:tRNA nucleotidyltransferase (CCA-adding enzyme)
MDQFLDKGKEVLKILINNGCEAYLIGDVVYNTIMQNPIFEVEITTNATPDMVKGIFSLAKVEPEAEGRVRLFYNGYEFVISTFRVAEKHRDNRVPLRVHYSKDLHDELACRDFTISAIAMSHAGKLTDAYKGFEDIQKKRIKTIGNPRVRFQEEPLLMLKALRMISELGFKVHSKTASAMRAKAKSLAKLSVGAFIVELKRIYSGKYFKKALRVMVDSSIHRYLPMIGKEFKRLENHYKVLAIDLFLGCAFTRNGAFHKDWEDLAQDPVQLQKVVELAIATPKSKYDNMILYTYGLQTCLDANMVNTLIGKAKNRQKQIKREFALLPITMIDELKFREKDILELTTNQAGDYATQIEDNMIRKVLKKELTNDYDTLKIFAINSLREMGILPSLASGEQPYREEIEPVKAYLHVEPVMQPSLEKTQEQSEKQPEMKSEYKPEPVFSQEQQRIAQELKQSEPIMQSYTELKIDQIERKIYEQEKRLQEKDAKIKELERQALALKLDQDVNSLVGQNLELLKDMNYIDKNSEKVMMSKELREVYKSLITNADPKYRQLKEDKNDKEN